ncbi:aminotransferase class III-fold pyridoxal phosphate-dependent enzyme [Streptomyces sp. NPDC048182]|uniref:aminotransferase class III-fold pyridoxal phosphate-dependent enzyme n=1 Tax=Streptomyces sp. NPDC048182 TaxID=3365507 RepID=UPI00372327B6
MATVRPGGARHTPSREPAARASPGAALPIVPVRARGLTVEGADGRRYLDCVSGGGKLVLGHNHPVVLAAVRKILDSGAPLQGMGRTTPAEDAFVAELRRTLPPGLGDDARVRFCGVGGADAIGAAVDLVRAATGRERVLACTPVAGGRGLGPVPAPYESYETCDSCGDLGELGPGADRPAGVLLEPAHGPGGLLCAPDAWVRRLRQSTSAHSVALIADERGTGAGRTGAFWAVDHSGVTPDVLVLSDAVGGGLPLAALAHRAELDPGPSARAAFRPNQLALAAGTATLAHLRENRLAEHAAALGARMLARLRELGDSAPVGAVRGRGLLIGLELTAPDGDARLLADTVRRECLRRGLIVDAAGPAVRLLPPLTITEEQATAVLDRLADAVQAASRPRGGPAPPRSRAIR